MIVEAAPAKLNLALHVRRRRADGYHDIETVFAFAAHGDILRAVPAESPSFTVTGPFAAALAGEGDNLVLRAVRAFAEVWPEAPTLAITLDKRLPVASGIGGGSADAAAMLRVLARLTGVDRDDVRLNIVAAGLGADVPACLLGRAAIGKGRGEALTSVGGLAGMPALLVNPGVGVSTSAVFAGWDGVDRGALPRGETMEVARGGRNDLEAPARAVAPVIGDVLAALAASAGASLVRMSGSGATCFALYATVAECDRAGTAVSAAHPGWWCLETELT